MAAPSALVERLPCHVAPAARPLGLWVVFDHPHDHPFSFVARKFYVGPRLVLASDEVMIAADLEALRRELRAEGRVRMARDPSDDPTVMESWL